MGDWDFENQLRNPLICNYRWGFLAGMCGCEREAATLPFDCTTVSAVLASLVVCRSICRAELKLLLPLLNQLVLMEVKACWLLLLWCCLRHCIRRPPSPHAADGSRPDSQAMQVKILVAVPGMRQHATIRALQPHMANEIKIKVTDQAVEPSAGLALLQAG